MLLDSFIAFICSEQCLPNKYNERRSKINETRKLEQSFEVGGVTASFHNFIDFAPKIIAYNTYGWLYLTDFLHENKKSEKPPKIFMFQLQHSKKLFEQKFEQIFEKRNQC